jgi:hypothetical protein
MQVNNFIAADYGMRRDGAKRAMPSKKYYTHNRCISKRFVRPTLKEG